MSYFGTTDFALQAARGKVAGASVFNKFGRNGAVGTSSVPITMSGFYRTPTAATALEVVSSSINDTSAGSGARQVTLVGLDSNWAEVTQTVTMNGTTAVAVGTNLIRLYRAYVSSSGTYGSQSAGSHAGTITIRESGAGQTWNSIDIINSFPVGQTLIGAYTVPSGYSLYLNEYSISVETTKACSFQLFARDNADDVSSPYAGAVRVRKSWDGITGSYQESEGSYMKFDQKSDVGFLGYTASGTATASINFSGFLVAN